MGIVLNNAVIMNNKVINTPTGIVRMKMITNIIKMPFGDNFDLGFIIVGWEERVILLHNR